MLIKDHVARIALAQGTVLFANATNGILNDERNCPHTPYAPVTPLPLFCDVLLSRRGWTLLDLWWLQQKQSRVWFGCLAAVSSNHHIDN
jgi:hypothetical protein